MRIKKHLFLVEGPNGPRLRCHQDPAWHADIEVLDVHDPNDPHAHVTARPEPAAKPPMDEMSAEAKAKADELTAKDVADAADLMGFSAVDKPDPGMEATIEPELDGMTPAEPDEEPLG